MTKGNTDKLPEEYHGVLPPQHDPISQEYLKYLENLKLPESRTERKKVLIVGAGMAGIISAILLKKAGHDIRIVEASQRVGGRCMTLRNPPPPSDWDEVEKLYGVANKLYFEDSELSAEAGAMRLPDHHHLVQKLIEMYELNRFPFHNLPIDKKKYVEKKNTQPAKENVTYLNINYRHIKRSEYESGKSKGKMLGYDLHSKEVISDKTAGELLNWALEQDPSVKQLLKSLKEIKGSSPDFNSTRYQHLNESLQKAWWAVIKTHNDKSMLDFLKAQRLSYAAIEMIGVIENLESRLPLSFIHSLKTRSSLNPNSVYWGIEGGTDQLPRKIFSKENLLDYTYFNQTLTDIYRDKEEGKEIIRIKTRISESNALSRDLDQANYLKLNGGTDNQSPEDALDNYKSGQGEYFDEVIITIPFSSLRMVNTWSENGEGFSPGKHRAIRQFHYDAATKVFLEFRERFWEKEENIFGGGSVTDRANRFVYYPSTNMNEDKGGIILASYCWADDARKWDSMSEEDRFDLALHIVAILHAKHDRTVDYNKRHLAQKEIKELAVFNRTRSSKLPKGAATMSWAQNSHAFGEAGIFLPGQMRELFPLMLQSEWDSRVHFAGDHISQKSAWLEGAIESGIRASLLVNGTDLPKLRPWSKRP